MHTNWWVAVVSHNIKWTLISIGHWKSMHRYPIMSTLYIFHYLTFIRLTAISWCELCNIQNGFSLSDPCLIEVKENIMKSNLTMWHWFPKPCLMSHCLSNAGELGGWESRSHHTSRSSILSASLISEVLVESLIR